MRREIEREIYRERKAGLEKYTMVTCQITHWLLEEQRPIHLDKYINSGGVRTL